LIDQEKIHNQCFSDDPEERRLALDKLIDFSSMPDKQSAWIDLHRLTTDENRNVRFRAVEVLDSAFSQVPDEFKQQAWNDLVRLTTDEDRSIRSYTADTLGSAFSQVPYEFKQQAWNDLHRLANDAKNNHDRSRVADALGSAFSQVPNEFKQQAWNDLVRLTTDEDRNVRFRAVEVLDSAFSQVPDEFKQQAWNDLVRLTTDEDSYVRYHATYAIVSSFSQIPDKQSAWNNLIRLTNDEDSYVRSLAANVFCSAFSQVPDEFKQKAWNNLIRLTTDGDRYIRHWAADALGSAFSQVPYEFKQQAWNDLHRLINCAKNNYVRSRATYFLGSAFSQVPDEFKQQAWKDLHRLTNDAKNNYDRSRAADALGSAFFQVPNELKQSAWNDLHRFTTDEDSYVRSCAADTLGSAFSQVPDEFKQQAWNDLHTLTNDDDSYVRSRAADALGSVFSQAPNEFKQQAWNDLHMLTNDEDSYVRSRAAGALGSAFSQVPDEFKQQVWNNLVKLTYDEESDVRSRAAWSLGFVFSQVPDKQSAWNNLVRLTTDEDSDVRTHAQYSFGKVSIFKASQVENEEDYKKELEKAIEYFEKAAQESYSYSNPSSFCLPFYRSFYTIIFKKHEAKEEVDKYLKEAKAAIKGSESKGLLFEAVENLATALKEVQNLRSLDLQGMKCELNSYRKYCEHATELMRDVEERAPFATKMIMRGLPIMDRILKRLIEEIQEEAKIACKELKGTATEEIACAVSGEVQQWEVSNQKEMTQNIESLIEIFRLKMPNLPGYEDIFREIEGIRNEKDLGKQYKVILRLIGLIPMFVSMPDYVVNTIKNIDKNTNDIEDNIIGTKNLLKLNTDRKYAYKAQSRNQAVILTAIPDEYKAIKSYLTYLKEDQCKGTLYEVGQFVTVDNGIWDIAIAEIGIHNPTAALETERACEYFRPNVILFVGVAGGIKDVAIGDVVAVTKAYAYEHGKVVVEHGNISSSFKIRPDAPESTHALIHRARKIARDENWINRIDPEYTQKPKAFVGPIASGEKVIASTRSAIYKFIRSEYNDAIAVDEESHGFLRATHADQELMSIVIRGISDNLDKKFKSDSEGSQILASKNAAAFAFELISQHNFNEI
jgi:HEAT repeat protein/nucleoside phosphorylase